MSDYDMSIHHNPDGMAWAKFFVETTKDMEVEALRDESYMVTWFSNAMMAMHDHIKGIRWTCGDQIQHEIDQARGDGIDNGAVI